MSGNNRLLGFALVCLGFAGGLRSPDSYAGALDDVRSTWPEAKLRAALSQPEGREVEQGMSFEIRIGTEQDASVLLVLVDSQGRAEVLRPHRADTADRVSPGTDLSFPDATAGETLYAAMPLGKAYVYVLASPDSLVADGDPALGAGTWVDEAQIGLKLVDAVQKEGKVAVRRIPIDVTSAAVTEFISRSDFVEFFDPLGPRTRGVCQLSRGIAVQFAHDSAELTDWGRKQLNDVVAGMQDQKVRAVKFMIVGHTDDVGSDEYNVGLSGRRATRVQMYLADRGVDEGRLSKRAVGKADPAVPGTSDAARAKNRRVEIERVDQSDACSEKKR